MSSPGSPPPGSPPGRDALAAAAELRTRQASPKLTAAQMDAEHMKRQKFRRLLDPGITRPNSKEQALRSLRVRVALVCRSYRIVKRVLDFAHHSGESITRAQ